MLVLGPGSRERITLENGFNLNLASLKQEVQKKSSLPDFTFIHRGKILKDDAPLVEQGIVGGSIVQVVPLSKRKNPNEQQKPAERKKYTEADVQEIVIQFRTVSVNNFHKASKPEFIEKILDKYPNLRNNLSAVAFLKDPILLASIGNPATVRRLAEQHTELLEASQFIVDTLNNKAITPAVAEPIDELTDSSDSSESALPSTSRGRVPRHITSNQLASALGQVLAATAGSSNSLANISQRTLNENASTTESAPTPNRVITNSMFMNALSEVLRSTRSNNQVRGRGESLEESGDVPEPALTPTGLSSGHTVTPGIVPPPLYDAELREMREMGLTDMDTNLQALILSNGDLETAINIVLSGGGSN